MTYKNTTPYCTKQRVFFISLSTFLILFGLYVYFISASVVEVVTRKEVEREIAQTVSRIGELESEYITAKQAITEGTLSHFGFQTTPAEKIYVEKVPTNLVLVRHDAE